MGTAWDVAFGRLAIQHGLVSQEAVRLAFQQLPPGQTLGEELVRRGQLAPDRAAQLAAWLRASATPSGRLPTAAAGPPPDDGVTLRGPAPQQQPAPDDGATIAGGAPTSNAAPPERLPEVGEVVGGYALEGLLGKGGMGAVFRARDPRTGAPVALKVLLPGADPDGSALARFRREAEALAKVDAHAGIVRVRGVGSHQGLPFAVMDLVHGRDLHAIVKSGGALEVERALRYTEAVARAVHHCHAKGVLHRDLKPANVLLREADDTPLVMDFGLALDHDAERLTKTGEVMGTPAYMSPEQAEGEKTGVDARTDVYALGAILFELVTGRPPFEGQPFEILKKVFLDMPPAIASLAPRAPADVDVVARKAMAKDKALRYESAAALADDVARLRRGEPIQARAPTRWQELRWRFRRRDRRLFRSLTLAVVLATLPLAGVVVHSTRKRQQAQAGLAAAAGELLVALRDDGWPLVGSTGGPVFGAAQRALACDARLTGADDDAVAITADAVTALRDRLRSGAGPVGEVRDRLDDPAAADLALTRLARRLRMTHDAGPACQPGAHAPWWADEERPAGPDPEERLVAALRDLRWGCHDPGRPALTLAEAEAALAALNAVGEVGVPAAALMARSVLAEVDALEDAIRDALSGGRQALLEQVQRSLERSDVSANLSRPSSWRTPIAGGRLEACLSPLRTQLELEEAAALLARTAAAIPPRVDWKDPRIYRCLARLLSEAAALPGDASPAELERALAAPTIALVFDVGERADAAGVMTREFSDLAIVAAPLLTSLDPIEVDGRRYTHHGAASCLVFSCFEQLQAGAQPTAEALAAAARFGFEPRITERQGDIEPLLALIDDAATRYPIGELFFMRATLLQARREGGRGDRAGRDRRRSPENVERLVDDLAVALGERLGADTRAALGLGPPRPGVKPLLEPQATIARGRLAYLRLRLEVARPKVERAVFDACHQLLQELLRERGAAMRADDRAKLLKETAEATHKLLDPDRPEPPDPAWASILRARCVELWSASVDAALESAERALRGAEAGERTELAGRVSAIQTLDLDADQALKIAVASALRGLASVEGTEAMLARYEAAADRIRAMGRDVPVELLDDWWGVAAARGRVDRAEALAAQLIEQADRELPRLVDDDDRQSTRKLRSRARALLARQRLAAGDREGALALREAARAAGDLDLAEGRKAWDDLPLDGR